MKESKYFTIDREGCPPTVFERLWVEGSEFPGRHGIRIDAKPEDTHALAIVDRLMKICREEMIPGGINPPRAGHYQLLAHYHYDEQDLATSELLELRPTKALMADAEKNPDGSMEIKATPAVANLTGAWNMTLKFLMSDLIRDCCIAEGLIGPTFAPVTVRGARQAVAGTVWKLGASITMPKLSNTQDLRHVRREGEVEFDGVYSDNMHLRDGLHSVTEIHYRRSDLERMEPFDLAVTYEPLQQRAGRIIASPRFYRFCKANKLRFDYMPVRVDEA
jgi:hypothetical protein